MITPHSDRSRWVRFDRELGPSLTWRLDTASEIDRRSARAKPGFRVVGPRPIMPECHIERDAPFGPQYRGDR